MQVKDIMQALEKLAPQQLKEDWDNVGLQLGDPNAEVRRVLLALTPSLAVSEEAVRRQVDLIVSHPPFIFKGVKSLRTDSAIGRMSQLCLKHDIAIYSAHTNLDVARGGVNDVLAERLGLMDVEGLAETARKPRYKLVVFVPLSHLEQVKAALRNAISLVPGILPEPEPFVRVSGYGESNIDYVVRVWCKTADYWTVYYDLMEAVGAAFDAHGVSMSYPQMNVHVLDTPESAKKD